MLLSKTAFMKRQISIREDKGILALVSALRTDALKHPDRLLNVKDVWDEEWDRLLKYAS